jgi:hypothetical protein
MCLRRAPEKYIAGAALDRAGLRVLATVYNSDNLWVFGLCQSKLKDITDVSIMFLTLKKKLLLATVTE